MAPFCHFAEFLDLTLHALTLLPIRSPRPLIEGPEEPIILESQAGLCLGNAHPAPESSQTPGLSMGR
jgi:hypothetical protein